MYEPILLNYVTFRYGSGATLWPLLIYRKDSYTNTLYYNILNISINRSNGWAEIYLSNFQKVKLIIPSSSQKDLHSFLTIP